MPESPISIHILVCDDNFESCASRLYLHSAEELRRLDKKILPSFLSWQLVDIVNEKELLTELIELGSDSRVSHVLSNIS
jgi:hypothetical protein